MFNIKENEFWVNAIMEYDKQNKPLDKVKIENDYTYNGKCPKCKYFHHYYGAPLCKMGIETVGWKNTCSYFKNKED